MGHYAPAVKDLSRAARLAPSNAAARFAYGAALAATGDDAGAVGELGVALELRAAWGASYPEAHLLRAQSLERLGRAKDAISDYKAFVAAADGDSGLVDEIAQARDSVIDLRRGR